MGQLRESIYISFLGLLQSIPQTGWLKTTEMYSFTVVEAGSPKSQCWPGCTASKEEASFLSSSSFWWPQAFLGLWTHHSNLCLCLHMAFIPVSLCLLFFSLKNIYLFLVASGLSCGTWDLLLLCAGSVVGGAGSVFGAHGLSSCGAWAQ